MKTLELTLCRIRNVTLLLFLGLFLFVPSVSGATSTQEVVLTQQEYITLQKNLIMLENTIDSQLSTIEELEKQLSIAKTSTSEQSQQVIELQNILREQKQQLTEAQIYAMSYVIALLCVQIGIPLDIQHVMTHAEAADNKDGMDLCYNDPTPFPNNTYGPDSTCERWDLWVLHQGDPEWSGGDNLRGNARFIASNEWGINI